MFTERKESATLPTEERHLINALFSKVPSISLGIFSRHSASSSIFPIPQSQISTPPAYATSPTSSDTSVCSRESSISPPQRVFPRVTKDLETRESAIDQAFSCPAPIALGPAYFAYSPFTHALLSNWAERQVRYASHHDQVREL